VLALPLLKIGAALGEVRPCGDAPAKEEEEEEEGEEGGRAEEVDGGEWGTEREGREGREGVVKRVGGPPDKTTKRTYEKNKQKDVTARVQEVRGEVLGSLRVSPVILSKRRSITALNAGSDFTLS